MKLPKIKFEYSLQHDSVFRGGYTEEKRWGKYPSYKAIYKYIKTIEPMWRKVEKPVFKKISELTGFKWKREIIPCYVVGRCRPYSSPLTIGVFEKYPNWFVDVLTHELIHNIYFDGDNEKKFYGWWNHVLKKYREPKVTKTHIHLHAVHKQIYLDLFNEKRLRRNIKLDQRFLAYAKSWKIVERDGHLNILKEFKKLSK